MCSVIQHIWTNVTCFHICILHTVYIYCILHKKARVPCYSDLNAYNKGFIQNRMLPQ